MTNTALLQKSRDLSKATPRWERAQPTMNGRGVKRQRTLLESGAWKERPEQDRKERLD